MDNDRSTTSSRRLFATALLLALFAIAGCAAGHGASPRPALVAATAGSSRPGEQCLEFVCEP